MPTRKSKMRTFSLGVFVTHAGRQKLSFLLTTAALLNIFSITFRYFPGANIKGICLLADVALLCLLASVTLVLTHRPKHYEYLRASMLAHQVEQRAAAAADGISVKEESFRSMALRHKVGVVGTVTFGIVLLTYAVADLLRFVPQLQLLRPDGSAMAVPRWESAMIMVFLSAACGLLAYVIRFRITDDWDESLEHLMSQFRPTQ